MEADVAATYFDIRETVGKRLPRLTMRPEGRIAAGFASRKWLVRRSSQS